MLLSDKLTRIDTISIVNDIIKYRVARIFDIDFINAM